MDFRNTFGIACGMSLFAAASAFAQLPKASELVSDMGFGMNIGNTMEAPDGPTTWGNVYPTKAIIDSMKAAGFNTIRIPCAWVTHADTTTNTINTSWMDSVKTVVDYVINDGMYAILNIHWDSGWLEDRVFDGFGYGKGTDSVYNDASVITKRQEDFWRQIGERFKDYDQHLLFASANEPGVNDPWLASGQYAFDETRMAVLKQYHEAFLNVVRGQGGNNATRSLIVQAPRTDEAYAFSLLANNMPTDPAGDGYMMAEIHFYPYQWSLMTADESWGNVFRYWGEGNYSTHDVTHNANYVKSTGATGEQYAGEAYTDSIFAKLGKTFTSKGIPVVIGEYAAIKRIDDFTAAAGAEANCDDLKLHLQSRISWYSKVTSLSKQYGIVPVHWDVGGEENSSNTIIRRQNGNTGIWDYGVLNAMRRSYGLDTLVGESYSKYYTSCADISNKAVVATYDYSKVDSAFGQMGFSVTQSDISKYDSLVVRTYVQGSTNGACSGEYGFLTMDIVTMDNVDWRWRAAHLDASVSSDEMGKWVDYGVKISSNESDTADGSILVPHNPSKLGFLGLQTYQKYFTGIIAVDYILFINKSTNTYDTLYTFNKSSATPDGAVTNVSLESTAGISSVTVPTVGSCKETSTTDNSVKAVYSITDSLWGQIAFSVAKDWSNYTSVSAKVYTKGTTTSTGTDYGYVSFSFVTMDGANWDWQEASLGNAEMDSWKIYSADIASTGTSGANLMVPSQINNVAFFALQIYSKHYSGAVYVDWIAFTKADGTADTLSLNSTGASEFGGGISSATLIATSSVETDNYKVSIMPTRAIAASKMLVSVQQGMVNATFTAATAGSAKAVLVNGLGQVIAAQNFAAKAGTNNVQLTTGFRGPAMLIVKQGSQKFMQKVILK